MGQQGGDIVAAFLVEMHRLGIELAKLTSVTVTLNYTHDFIYFVFEVVDPCFCASKTENSV